MAGAANRLAYLEAMGIKAWVPRQDPDAVPSPIAVSEPVEEPAPAAPAAAALSPEPVPVDAPLPVAETAPAPGAPATRDWDALRSQVLDCRRCGLCESRTHAVFGVGDPGARWLVVGEAPGADEDRQGEPFVGRAGQLLNAMLQAAGCQREQVFIANVLKCRPPDNRDPQAEEMAACAPHLARQIELIQPGLILAVGRIAAQHLLQTDIPVGRLRGIRHVHADTGIPVVVTYHPAYLLRKPSEKRKAWDDLRLALSCTRPVQ